MLKINVYLKFVDNFVKTNVKENPPNNGNDITLGVR